MASGSNYLTTYYAKRIIGDTAAETATKALLQTGTGIENDIWILHRTNRASLYGIKYMYDDTANGTADRIELYGGHQVSSVDTATAWVQLDTGDVYILGRVGINYDPSDNNNTYSLYVNGTTYVYGTTYLNDAVGIGYDPETGGNAYKLYVNGSSYIYGTTYLNDAVGIGYDPATNGNTYKLYVDGDTYFDDNTYLNGKVGIGYDPNTSGNAYKLYVDGTSYFNNNINSTGNLYIKNTSPHIILANTNWTKGTQPSTNYYSALEFQTNSTDYASNKRLGLLEVNVDTSNNTWMNIWVVPNASDSTSWSGIRLKKTSANVLTIYNQGNTEVSGTITFNGDGIYHAGTAATQRIIRIIDSGDQYGTGVSIGAGGLAIFGSGESANTLISSLTLTAGGSETTYIASDNNILFYPGQNSYDASALITMSPSRIWAGVNGDTTREAQTGCQSGAGQIYLWSAAATSGNRGLYLPAHGTGGAVAIIAANTNNSITILGNDVWGSSVRLVDNWIGFYNARQGGTRYGYIQANADRMYYRKENGVSTYHHDFNGHIYASSNLYAGGSVLANNGYLYSTANGVTVQIGGQNSGCCHIYISQNVPFAFNRGFLMVNSGDIGTSTYPTGNIVVKAGGRVSGNGGALYLGNSNNANWVYVQDMASQSGTNKWAIHQTNGNAEFYGTVTVGALNGAHVNMNGTKRDLQIRYGGVTLDYGKYTTVTFSPAFSNACLMVAPINQQGGYGAGQAISVDSYSKTSCRMYNYNTASAACWCGYIAIGY